MVLGTIVGCSTPATNEEETAAVSGTLFTDNFDTMPTSWDRFEEIVGGIPDGGVGCYTNDIGLVEQTTEQHQSGPGSLRVDANAARTVYSNHLIAHHPLGTTGVDTRLTYSLWAFIDPQAGQDGLHEGQTGPELSLQRTRLESGVWRTRTAGIQYIANRWSGQGTWQIWTDTGNGSAGWVAFARNATLTPARWTQITLVANLATNRYESITVQGAGVSMKKLPLSQYSIVGEQKFYEDALQLTLEGENAWSNCGDFVYEYRVYYDAVKLTAG
jgi:hypothetical protein